MKSILMLCFVALLFSCNNKKNAAGSHAEDAVIDDPAGITPAIPQYNPETGLYIWHATADYKKVKNPALPANGINSADSLIRGLNEYYENVYLEKIKQSGDTLYSIIKDNKYLGSQMGSTGAEIYLADVILNLTSVPGIRYVSIEMEVADHVSPGTWSAQDFSKYTEAIK